jgi:hypothetical protein
MRNFVLVMPPFQQRLRLRKEEGIAEFYSELKNVTNLRVTDKKLLISYIL